MGKRILILTIALLQLTALFADYKNYEMELVHTFKDDYNIEDLETDMSGHRDYGPSAFTFDDKNNLIVGNNLSRRIVIYDEAFNYVSQIQKCESSRVSRLLIKDNILLGSDSEAFHGEDLNGNLLFYINIYKMKKFKQISFNTYFNYENNTVTLSTWKGEIYTLKNPGLDNKYNEKNLIKVEDKKSISSRSSDSETEFISSYFNFLEDIEPEVQSRTADTKLMSLSDIEIESPSTMEYIGQDSDGNYYWNDDYDHIIIFNKDKQLIDAFNFDIEHVQIDPVVHPSGDVYFMDIYEDGTDLYRVKRVW